MPVISWPDGSSCWAGNLGGLVEIPGLGVNSFKVTGTRKAVTTDTIGGGRRAQYVRLPRTWTVDVPTMPLSDMSGLSALAEGMYGNGPFQWVTPDMQAGNLLTPSGAALRDVTGNSAYAQGGPAMGTSGSVDNATFLPGSISGDGTEVQITAAVPIRRGTPLSYSVFATNKSTSGPVWLRVKLVDVTGAVVETQYTTRYGSTATLERVSDTYTPTSFRAVAAYLTVQGASRIAGPAITWTPKATPFTQGLGVKGVVLTVSGVDAKWTDDEGPWSGMSITAEEVNS